MKIAILTQPLKSNYGGMLQAFALQSTLKNLGHDVVTIDRQLNDKSNFRRILSFCKDLLRLITLKKVPHRFDSKQQNLIFENTLNFIRSHIKLTERIGSDRNMRLHFADNNYDAVIVGSDQTWRPSYSPNIYNFYLDFLTNSQTKRIAYATSFGVDHWEYSKFQTMRCRELASRFNAISVRERSGVNLCKTHLNADAEFVLDPTLLLSANDYLSRLEINTENNRSNGLFTYILDSNEDKNSAITKVAEHLKLRPFSSQATSSILKGDGKIIEDYVLPKVEEWIKGIHNAEYVITDSFHGCVFAIIFNKPFLAIGNVNRGQARFDSLLKLFNLEHRLISNSSQVNLDITSDDIDWPSINRTLIEHKTKSLKYITTSLGNNT